MRRCGPRQRPSGVADVERLVCVDRHRIDFRALVSDEVDVRRGRVDVALRGGHDGRGGGRRRPTVRWPCTTAPSVTADDVLSAPAQPVEPCDTTGAGDLAAGFLYGVAPARRSAPNRCESPPISRRSPPLDGVAYALMSDLRSVARRWLAAGDEDMRQELEDLLAGPDDELTLRFDGRLPGWTARRSRRGTATDESTGGPTGRRTTLSKSDPQAASRWLSSATTPARATRSRSTPAGLRRTRRACDDLATCACSVRTHRLRRGQGSWLPPRTGRTTATRCSPRTACILSPVDAEIVIDLVDGHVRA